MIVVTGPGRSGTSLVAQLYRELGFDPGGRWHADVRAGLEAREIVDLNRRIERYVGMGPFDGGKRRRPLGTVLRRAVRDVRRGRTPRLRRPRVDAPPAWSRVEPAVSRYGAQARELARSHPVVKDPRFCHTLRVWAAADAEIEHVLVCVRAVDAMSRSRTQAGHAGRASEDVVRNALVYRLGLCLTTLHEFAIEHRVVTFPGFAHRPETLFDAMRFPRAVPADRFAAAFERVVRPELITELRPDTRPLS